MGGAMKTSTLPAAILCAAALGGLTACSDDAPGAASMLEMTPNPIDFGDVAYQEQVEKDVVLRNRGDREVLLKAPSFDCSCFQLQRYPSSVLRAGESVTLRLVMLTGRTDPREFHKQLTIVSDDPASPLVVPIRGEVVEYLRVSPREIALGPVPAKAEPFSKAIEVRAGKGFVVTVGKPQSTDARLTLEVKPADGGADVVVRTVPGAGLGRLNAQVVVPYTVEGRGKPPYSSKAVIAVTGEIQ